MNDLTFGATLLSFFATLLVAVTVEITGAPTLNANAVAAVHAPAPVIKANGKDCVTVALATTRAR